LSDCVFRDVLFTINLIRSTTF